jgi:hypothetical protein
MHLIFRRLHSQQLEVPLRTFLRSVLSPTNPIGNLGGAKLASAMEYNYVQVLEQDVA